MKVSEVMTPDVETLRPQDTIRVAAVKMKKLDVGSLPICDGERVLGMVTDRDIVIRAIAEGLAYDTPAEKVMTRAVETIYMDEDIKDAAHRMREHQLRRILVLDNDKRLVGILTLGDISHDGDARTVARTLEQISEPSGAH